MNRAATIYRHALVIGIAASWVVLVVLMWAAFRRLPSAEELADARHVRPPLPADFIINVAESGGVTALLIAILWPRTAWRYILRTCIALVVLATWFLMSVPLDLNNMEWLHRRWLALMIVLLLFTLLTYPLLARRRRIEPES